MKVVIDNINGNKVYFSIYWKDGRKEHYMTNDQGEGLFEADNYYKQYKGTLQFQLTQKTRSGIRKAIIRQLELEKYKDLEEY